MAESSTEWDDIMADPNSASTQGLAATKPAAQKGRAARAANKKRSTFTPPTFRNVY